jgi:hypothetical protein
MGERLAGDSVERPEQSWVPLAKDGSRDLSTSTPSWSVSEATESIGSAPEMSLEEKIDLVMARLA